MVDKGCKGWHVAWAGSFQQDYPHLLQGESDWVSNQHFPWRLHHLLALMRALWGPKLPIAMVLLSSSPDTFGTVPALRAAQIAALRITAPPLVLTSAHDLGVAPDGEDALHPPYKREVGDRLYAAVNALIYGSSEDWRGPLLRSATVQEDWAHAAESVHTSRVHHVSILKNAHVDSEDGTNLNPDVGAESHSSRIVHRNLSLHSHATPNPNPDSTLTNRPKVTSANYTIRLEIVDTAGGMHFVGNCRSPRPFDYFTGGTWRTVQHMMAEFRGTIGVITLLIRATAAPLKVRFNYQDQPQCFVHNRARLPLMPFLVEVPCFDCMPDPWKGTGAEPHCFGCKGN